MERSAKIAISITTAITAGVLIYIFRKNIGSIFGVGKPSKKAAKLALEEWDKWGRGQVKEGSSTTIDRLREYWRKGGGVNWSDERMKDEAWSAAFISYLMKMSGASDNFKYSTSHSVYIRDAVKNRKQNNTKTFKAFKPEEVKVEVGDLVCYPRQSGVGYDSTGSYKSHCDIITSVKDGYAESVGGNISNSVSKTKVPLNKNGQIDKSKDRLGYGGYFAIIKNRS